MPASRARPVLTGRGSSQSSPQSVADFACLSALKRNSVSGGFSSAGRSLRYKYALDAMSAGWPANSANAGRECSAAGVRSTVPDSSRAITQVDILHAFMGFSLDDGQRLRLSDGERSQVFIIWCRTVFVGETFPLKWPCAIWGWRGSRRAARLTADTGFPCGSAGASPSRGRPSTKTSRGFLRRRGRRTRWRRRPRPRRNPNRCSPSCRACRDSPRG